MVTLKEIAKVTGLAESTISRALNRDPSLSITDENRRLIIETAEELNYVPRRARAALKEDSSVAMRRPEYLRSVLIFHAMPSEQELSRPFHLGIRQGIEARCEAYGVHVMRVFPGEFRPTMLHRDTAIAAIAVLKLDDEKREALATLDIPLCIAHPPDPSPLDDVAYIDIEHSAVTLTEWMLAQGVKRPALIGTPGPHSLRFKGFRSVMHGADRFDPDYTVSVPSEDYPAGKQVEELLGRLAALKKPRPDGLIVYADRLAPGAYQALRAAGLSIPGDVAVAGFGDTSMAQMLDPPLTSLRFEAGLVGESCVDLLMERIGGRAATKHVRILSQVVARESTDRASARAG